MQHFSLSSKIPLVVVVVVVVIIITGPFSAHCSTQLKVTILDRLPLDDHLFTQNVIMEVSARSQIECSKKCVETEGCVMCTFHSSPEGPSLPGLCRLHSQLQKDTDVKQSKAGARSLAPRRQNPNIWGYVSACNTCVKVVTTAATYATATDQCEHMGGHLIRAQTSTKSDCLWTLRNTKGLQRMWLGADDIRTANQFQWSDGVPLPTTSSLWSPGEPDTSTLNDCVYFNPAGKGLWDATCTEKYAYMCENPSTLC